MKSRVFLDVDPRVLRFRGEPVGFEGRASLTFELNLFTRLPSLIGVESRSA
jgi:hypothetical protein